MSSIQTGSPLKHASRLKTALLLIDIQAGLTTESGFYGTQRSNPQFERNIATLLSQTRQYNASARSPDATVFIIHVFHNSTNPSSPLYPTKPTNAILPWAAPVEGEPVLSKSVHSAFIGTSLEATLHAQGIRQLLICGITADHCVSTTTRMASDLGVVNRDDDDKGVVALVQDAAAAFNKPGKFDAETVHAVNVASLEEEFAQIVKTEEVLAEVLGGRK